MDAFKAHFQDSKAFTRLYIINFMLLAGTFLIGLTRLGTGIMRDRPVMYLVFILIALFSVSQKHLKQLARRLFTTIIPQHYKNQLANLSTTDTALEGHSYVLSTSFIAASFLDLPEIYRNPAKDNVYCGTGSSYGNYGGGCGGGCGSCGGCGGCGG